MVIQDELSSREVGHPVVMLGVDKELKMLFDFLICMLSLTIWLRVICSGEGISDAKPLIQHFHKLCGKLWALVRDNFGWDAVESKNLSVM